MSAMCVCIYAVRLIRSVWKIVCIAVDFYRVWSRGQQFVGLRICVAITRLPRCRMHGCCTNAA